MLVFRLGRADQRLCSVEFCLFVPNGVVLLCLSLQDSGGGVLFKRPRCLRCMVRTVNESRFLVDGVLSLSVPLLCTPLLPHTEARKENTTATNGALFSHG